MEPATKTRAMLERILPWLVAGTACGLAACTYVWFLQHSDRLWYWSTHDRNFHYYLGLSIAWDIRTFDLGRLGYDIDSGGRTWGLVHAFLVAAIQLFVGGDYRLGVLPSLGGWIGSATMMYLLARRLVPRAGTAAGLTAVLFFFASPAYRAYSADIMLESLGATLSLLALLRYVIAVQDDAPLSGRHLGIALTLLFFLKYNYWLLAFAGIVVGEFCRRPDVYLAALRRLLSALADAKLWKAQLRRPLNYVIAILLGVIAFMIAYRNRPVEIFGQVYVFESTENVASVAYWCIFARFWVWYRRTGRFEVATWDERLQQAFRWHGLVVAWYFNWPKRLSYFAWFLSPLNNDSQRRANAGFLPGLPAYCGGLRDEYHAQHWMFWAALALAAVALLLWRRTRPGAGAVLAFVLVAAMLTFQHPMWKFRFMHSWAAALWLLSGAGVALAADVLGQLFRCRPAWFAGPPIAALAWLLIPWMGPPGFAQEGGVRLDRPSFLLLHETYLPSLQDSRDCTIVCNVPVWFSTDWTLMERYGRSIRCKNQIREYRRGAEKDSAILERWIDATTSDTVVLVDVATTSHFYDLTGDTIDLGPLRAFLENRPERFRLAQTWTLPEQTVVTRWERIGP